MGKVSFPSKSNELSMKPDESNFATAISAESLTFERVNPATINDPDGPIDKDEMPLAAPIEVMANPDPPPNVRSSAPPGRSRKIRIELG